MGLIRIAIVVAAGVALMPSDREQQQRLMQRASEATTWAMTFCDRNAESCAQAGALWKQFAAKAEFAAKLAWESWQGAQSEAGVAERGDLLARRKIEPVRLDESQRRASGTLTPFDMQPAWRGRQASRGEF
jgi:hypothetical protein